MKDLCTTKKYDLSQLNDEQLQAVLDWLKVNDKGWDNRSIKVFKPSYLSSPLSFYDPDFKIFGHLDETCTNALELFNEETHLLTAQDFVNASKGLAQIGVGLKELSDNLNSISKTINDKICLDSDIKSLIEKGKQTGLKIVVTFEKI